MDSAATNVAPHIASALAYFIAGLSLSSLMRTGQKIASSRVCSAASLRSECVLCTSRARSSLNLLGLSPERSPNTMNTLTSGILTNANARFPAKAAAGLTSVFDPKQTRGPLTEPESAHHNPRTHQDAHQDDQRDENDAR